MALNDEAIPQAVQLFEEQLEAARQRGVSPRYAQLQSLIQELRKGPLSKARSDELMSLTAEIQKEISVYRNAGANRSAAASTQLKAGQRESFQKGMQQALSTARERNLESQKKLPKSARRGRRNMI